MKVSGAHRQGSAASVALSQKGQTAVEGKSGEKRAANCSYSLQFSVNLTYTSSYLKSGDLRTRKWRLHDDFFHMVSAIFHRAELVPLSSGSVRSN